MKNEFTLEELQFLYSEIYSRLFRVYEKYHNEGLYRKFNMPSFEEFDKVLLGDGGKYPCLDSELEKNWTDILENIYESGYTGAKNEYRHLKGDTLFKKLNQIICDKIPLKSPYKDMYLYYIGCRSYDEFKQLYENKIKENTFHFTGYYYSRTREKILQCQLELILLRGNYSAKLSGFHEKSIEFKKVFLTGSLELTGQSCIINVKEINKELYICISLHLGQSIINLYEISDKKMLHGFMLSNSSSYYTCAPRIVLYNNTHNDSDDIRNIEEYLLYFKDHPIVDINWGGLDVMNNSTLLLEFAKKLK